VRVSATARALGARHLLLEIREVLGTRCCNGVLVDQMRGKQRSELCAAFLREDPLYASSVSATSRLESKHIEADFSANLPPLQSVTLQSKLREQRVVALP
jgi:hypothetical protein